MVACGELGWVGFVVVCLLYKIKPNPRKNICCGKKWPKFHLLTYIFSFLGLGWAWVGEFVGFPIIFMFYVFQPNIIW